MDSGDFVAENSPWPHNKIVGRQRDLSNESKTVSLSFVQPLSQPQKESNTMKSPLLALVLTFGGTIFLASSPAQAQIPLIRGGAPVFRPAYLRPDGPQPFSTRRSRELAAARSQSSFSRTTYYRPSSSYQRSGSVFQPSRRTTFLSRRGRIR